MVPSVPTPLRVVDVTPACQDEVRHLIAPYAPALVRIVHAAWDKWRQAEFGHWRTARSRAGFVWEEMIEHAHREFHGDDRIKVLPRNETFYFVLDGSLVFRFKKGDEGDGASNLPTQSALAFNDPQQALEGIPEARRVDVLYRLNRMETAVIDVRLVARDGERVAWSFSLLEAAEVTVLPAAPAADPVEAPARRSLVKARRRPADSAREGT